MVMEVLVGPATYTMEMDVSSSPSSAVAYVRERTGGGVVPAAAQDDDDKKVVLSSSCLFFKEEETGSDDSSESSSSIGAPGDSDEDDDDSQADREANGEISSSKLCLDSLEDSLPIKRGLSTHFSGKSKSFANLSDVSSTCTVKDLVKPENPFNKRRRVLIANKWSRKSSFYSWQNPKSMPLLTVHEDDHAVHDRDRDHHNPVAELGTEEEEEEEEKNQTRVCGNRFKKKIGFKSQSCFSLADLHEEDQP